MTHRRRKPRQHTPFLSLPRRQRRNQAVAMGWLARQSGNGFYTHHVLPGSTAHARMVAEGELAADDVSSWADFYFLSRRPSREGLFYNATAISIPMHVCDIVEAAAHDAADKALSAQDADRDDERLIELPRVGKHRTFTLAPAPSLASYGGKTRYGFMADFLRTQLDSLPAVSASVKLDREYAYGVGLLIVSEEPSIDHHSIPRIIQAFLDGGEQESEYPVDMDKHRAEVVKRLKRTIESWEWIDQRDRDQNIEG